MFRKITACATALTLTFVPFIQTNAEDKTMTVNVNGQQTSVPFNTTAGSEDVKELLGDAWYYGITADTFHFNGESETNFAVKSLDHQNGTGGQTGVTDKGQGSQKAFFIAGSVDSPFMIKGIDAEVITPESENDQFQNSCNTRNPISFINEDAEDISTYVDAMENAVEQQSQRLAALDSISDYTQLPADGKTTLDVTQAGDNTVYINVDEWPGLKNQFQQSSGVSLVKNAGQKVVFNFNTDQAVTLQKMTVSVNGTNEDTTGLANHSTTTGSSTAEDLIFNMPVATEVTLNDSTGIFLAPKAKVTSYGVDGGWLVADTFTNNCEWHFINGNLPKEITERKTVITPKHEGSVLGAKRSRPVATPQTEEKPAETPESEETPVPSTTPKTEEKPSEPTPVATPETTPAPTSTPEASVKPVSTPKTEEKKEETKKPVEKTEQKSETKKEQNVPAPVKTENNRHDSVINSKNNTGNATAVSEGTGTAKFESPNTGDHNDISIYSVLFFCAGIAMIGVIRRMRNEEE